MSQYREHHPGSSLADAVECFWTSQSISEEGPQRVYPDGCVDILYIRRPGGVTLKWVGTMTRWRDVPGGGAAELLGVRFRPGALGTRLPVLVDESADLAAIDRALTREVLDGLDRSLRPGAIVNVIQRLVERYGVKDPAARALRYLERHRGDVDLGWLAGQANLSERQFRRICEARTGLSPKRLARTLRFRQALDLTLQAAPGELTAVAHTCGFADQAHFTHEMRRFTGRTPSQLAEIYKRAALVVP
jgi:AraC-like DNA-binding protein